VWTKHFLCQAPLRDAAYTTRAKDLQIVLFRRRVSHRMSQIEHKVQQKPSKFQDLKSKIKRLFRKKEDKAEEN
jgi:hypothetical protein